MVPLKSAYPVKEETATATTSNTTQLSKSKPERLTSAVSNNLQPTLPSIQ